MQHVTVGHTDPSAKTKTKTEKESERDWLPVHRLASAENTVEGRIRPSAGSLRILRQCSCSFL